MALARIESNIRKMQAQGANQAQIREYITLEKAKGAGQAADTAFLNVMDSGSDLAGAAEVIGSGVREVRENPARTIGGVVGSVGGAAIGSLAGPATGVIGGAGGGAIGEAIGESIDTALFNREGRTLGERGTTAAITTGLGLAIPAIGGAIRRAAAPASTKAVETAAKTLASDSKGASAAFKNVLGKDAGRLSLPAEQTALTGAPQGTTSAKAAVQAERASKIFTDKPTEAAKTLAERREVIRQAVTGGIPSKDVAKKMSEFAGAATQAKTNLAQRQRDTTSVFATSKSNAPAGVSAQEINGIISDPKLQGALVAAGGTDAVEQFRQAINIPLTVSGPKGKAVKNIPTERDITNAIANMVQAAGRNPQVEAVFWRDTYENGIKPLLAGKSDTLSKTLAKQFEQRFALFRSTQPLGKKLYEGDVSFVADALSTPQNFDEAMQVWKDANIGGDFKTFAKNAILAQVSAPDGTVVSSKVRDFLAKTDPNTLDRALGKGYYQKLKDVGTTTAAIEAAGVESQIKGAARGLEAEPTFGERTSELLVSGATSAVGPANVGTLSIPARMGALAQTLFRGATGRSNSFADATVNNFIEQAARSEAVKETYPAYAALAASLGTPVLGVAEYTAQIEEIKNLEQGASAAGARIPTQVRDAPIEFDLNSELESIRSGESNTPESGGFNLQQELDSIRNGQGGADELAPSMQQQPDDLGQFIDGLMGQDQLGKTIDASVAQDDLDNLIRMQMMEDTKVASKVSTRQEEGFRTRMYRDINGFRTVGIGFNMDAAGARKLWEQAGVKTGFDDVLAGNKTISKGEAESLYTTTKTNARNGASRLVKNFNQLGNHQQDALADMVFQLGQAGAMAFARTRGLIEQGKFQEAAQAMMQSRNAKQTPNRVLRRAYMLENNVSLAEADAALVKAGKISRKESVNSPQDLSRLMGDTKVASAAPAPAKAPTKPAPKKRVRYAEAKAKRGLA